MSIQSHYKQTAIFKSFDETKDSFGMLDKSDSNWDLVLSTPCLFHKLIGDSKFVKGKETIYKTGIVFCGFSSLIRTEHRVTIDDIVYEIVDIKDANSRQHHLEIEVKGVE